MGQYECERAFSALYLCSAAISLIAIIGSAVVFGNWSATLNYPCINDVSDGVGRDGYGLGAFAAGDCGCIFYGKAMAVTSESSVGFQGGHTSICYFVIFSPVPIFVVSMILGLYHAYRFCFLLPRRSRKLRRLVVRGNQSSQWESADEEAGEERALKKRSRGRSPQRRKIDSGRKRARSASPAGRRPRSAAYSGNVVVSSNPEKSCTDSVKDEDSFACWAPISIVAVVVALLALSTAVVATDGYARTCSEWRRVALRVLLANGDLARVISTRLSCSAIYDFMDYLQPRKVIHYGYSYEKGGLSNRTVRDGDSPMINTSVALRIAMVAAWVNFLVWVILVVYNSYMAVKRQNNRKSKGKDSCCLCCKA